MSIKSLKTFEEYRFLYDDYAIDFKIAAERIANELAGISKRITLIVERASVCTTNVVMPSTVDIVWLPNAICNVSGSLTLQGTFFAGDYQLFSGNGTVLLNVINLKEVLPAWFGEDSTNLTKTRTAIASSGIPINLGKISSDPSVVGWGVAEGGTHWFNSTIGKKKMWNGTEKVLLG